MAWGGATSFGIAFAVSLCLPLVALIVWFPSRKAAFYIAGLSFFSIWMTILALNVFSGGTGTHFHASDLISSMSVPPVPLCLASFGFIFAASGLHVRDFVLAFDEALVELN
jgi:hypothetical protein